MYFTIFAVFIFLCPDLPIRLMCHARPIKRGREVIAIVPITKQDETTTKPIMHPMIGKAIHMLIDINVTIAIKKPTNVVIQKIDTNANITMETLTQNIETKTHKQNKTTPFKSLFKIRISNCSIYSSNLFIILIIIMGDSSIDVEGKK